MHGGTPRLRFRRVGLIEVGGRWLGSIVARSLESSWVEESRMEERARLEAAGRNIFILPVRV